MKEKRQLVGLNVSQAVTPEEIKQARKLFQEYATWLQVDLCFQGFAAELASLPRVYAPPRAQLLLAWGGGEALGCVALRPADEESCEMKRLFVRAGSRGKGIGRLLAERAVQEARTLGYRSIRLDTLPGMAEALRLYAALGFERRSCYYDTPLEQTIFMELRL